VSFLRAFSTVAHPRKPVFRLLCFNFLPKPYKRQYIKILYYAPCLLLLLMNRRERGPRNRGIMSKMKFMFQFNFHQCAETEATKEHICMYCMCRWCNVISDLVLYKGKACRKRVSNSTHSGGDSSRRLKPSFSLHKKCVHLLCAHCAVFCFECYIVCSNINIIKEIIYCFIA
jgi:hypothetical protein